MAEDLTSETLVRLLEAFSSDRQEAGLAYTRLRESLVRFFELKGDSQPEEAADAALDRVAAKLGQNSKIDDLTKYSLAVARFVFLERCRAEQKNLLAAGEFYAGRETAEADSENDDFQPFRECFESLPDEDKQLLRQYFADLSGAQMLEHRRKLAESRQLTLNHLRLRVFRIRRRLEDCLRRQR